MEQEIFESQHQVRSYECDLYGHVNNAVYLNYMEFARTAVLETKGIPLDKLKDMGWLAVIRKIEIVYKAPATFGNNLLIRTCLKEIGTTSITFHQNIYLDDQRIATEADVTVVFINLQGRPLRIPKIIQDAFSNGSGPT